MMEITLKQLKDLISQNKENNYVIPVNQSYELLRHEPITYLLCNKWGKVANIYRIEVHNNNIVDGYNTININVVYIIQVYQQLRIKDLNKISYETISFYNKYCKENDEALSLHNESNERRRYCARKLLYTMIKEVKND